MVSGGSGDCRSRGEARGDAETGEPRLAVDAVTRILAGLMSLWTRPALVRLAQRLRDADRQAQEDVRSPWARRAGASSGSPPGSLSTSIARPGVAREVERSGRPCLIQVIL